MVMEYRTKNSQRRTECLSRIQITNLPIKFFSKTKMHVQGRFGCRHVVVRRMTRNVLNKEMQSAGRAKSLNGGEGNGRSRGVSAQGRQYNTYRTGVLPPRPHKLPTGARRNNQVYVNAEQRIRRTRITRHAVVVRGWVVGSSLPPP